MRQGIAIAATCAVVVGCSSGTSTSPSGPPELVAFCTETQNASADLTYACHGGDRAAITAQLEAMGWCNAAAVTLGAAHVTFDADAAAACLADIASLACWQNMYASPNCRKVFTGTVPEGGECYPFLPLGAKECAAGTECTWSGSDCTGTCVARVTTPHLAVVGGPCMGQYNCSAEDGTLTCVGPNGPTLSDTGTCQVPAESGPCNYGYDCLTGACARAPGATTPGTCQAAKRVGDSCTPDNGECGPGTNCPAATNTCVVAPAVGEPCAREWSAPNCVDGVCVSSGRCAGYGNRGAACEPGLGPCRAMLDCDQTTLRCAPMCVPGNGCGARGQPCCVNKRCNADLWCNGRVCS